MPHSPLVSKILCPNPNEKRSNFWNYNYLIYIATREGVDLTPLDPLEKEFGSLAQFSFVSKENNANGLFGNNADYSDVNKLAYKIKNMSANGKNVYQAFISLHELDAVNAGYDDKKNWVDTMNIVMPDIGRKFNIPIDKLAWVAAVHMKKGNPHCHYMFWSTDDKVQDPYIHISKQHECRQMLSGEFFIGEHEREKVNKTMYRDLVVDIGKDILKEDIDYLFKNGAKISDRIKNENLYDTTAKLIELTNTLQEIQEKKGLKHKVLNPEAKSHVDFFVNDLIHNVSALKKEYNNYIDSSKKISDTYSPTAKREVFSQVNASNDVINRIYNGAVKPQIIKILKKKELLSQYLPSDNAENENISSKEEFAEVDFDTSFDNENPFTYEQMDFADSSDEESFSNTVSNETFKMEWSQNYKFALDKLYNDKTPDFELALIIMRIEAHANNVLAINDLAKMYEKGLGTDINIDAANQYYTKALTGFHSLLRTEDKTTYISYRLGKMYEQGKGCDIDFEKAMRYYKSAVADNHKYAQYSLGNMYLRGKGVEITSDSKRFYHDMALNLFEKSASQDNAYAAYAYSFLAENEYMEEVPKTIIDDFYKQALSGFEKMYEKQKTDDLAYRLGSMYHNGRGTDISYEKAIPYYEKSIEYKNYNAHYAIGKIYADKLSTFYDLEKSIVHLTIAAEEGNHVFAQLFLGKIFSDKEMPCYDIKKALDWYTKAADQDNDFAQYKLGRIYLEHEEVPQDIEKAINYFTLSADQGNQHAQFALGKCFSDKESDRYDIKTAIFWFEKSAEQNNSFAQLQLGKIYLENEDIPHDLKKAMNYFILSANQDNQYAQYALGKWFANKETEEYDINKAIYWLEKSAEQDNSFAQLKLGSIYLWGSHPKIKADEKLAMQYLNQAIKNGNEFAEDMIKMYENYKNNFMISSSYRMISNIFSTLVADNHLQKQNAEIAASAHKNISKKVQIAEAKREHGSHSQEHSE